jgi:hypothetical protein
LTWSLKAQGLAHPQLIIWLRVLLNICHIWEQQTARHSKIASTWFCRAATSVGIVNSCQSCLNQENIYHKTDPMPSHQEQCKYRIFVWVHRCVPKYIPLYNPLPMIGVDW